MIKIIPDSDVLEMRDAMKTDKTYYLQSRLLCEENMISDDYTTDDWIFIICNRNNRIKVAKYVIAHCHFSNILIGKLVDVKSKAVMNWKHSISQIYKKKFCLQSKYTRYEKRQL